MKRGEEKSEKVECPPSPTKNICKLLENRTPTLNGAGSIFTLGGERCGFDLHSRHDLSQK